MAAPLVFFCQQHRPDLIYVPEWLDHPNTVFGICGMTVLAETGDHRALIGKLEGLYGTAEKIDGGFQVATANGPIRIRSKHAVESDFGTLPSAIVGSSEPCIVALDMRYKNEEQLRRWIANSGFDHKEGSETLTLISSADTGNTFFRFCRS